MDWVERRGTVPNRHPWELSRAHSLLGLLKDFPLNTAYADVGAGDLFFAEQVARLTGKPVVAVDPAFPESGPSGPLQRYRRIEDVPAESTGGLLLLDVLEHAEDDLGFFRSALRVVKTGGAVIITVPAHPFLFSEHDVFLRHFRRYTKKALLALMEAGPVDVQECFYFYSSLFLVRYLFRERTGRSGVGTWPYEASHPLTRIIEGVLNVDFSVNRVLGKASMSFPGLSLCVIAKKK